MKKLTTDQLQRISIDEFKASDKVPVTVILDNIRSMNNVGSFFRTCDAFRVEKLFLCGYTPCPPHREITRSALGAELAVTWAHAADTAALVGQMKARGYTVIAVEQAEESVSLETFPFVPGTRYALVFGNEISGVDDAVMALADRCVEIPQFGTKHSLNVSVSAGIVLWEFVKHYLTKI